MESKKSIQSSVLIPIAKEPGSIEEKILLTKRTLHVDTHKGQVSFPGGVQDKSDESLLFTALRECEEEVGIKKEDIEVLGSLSPVKTPMGFQIHPWIGRFNLPYPFVVNPREVEKLLFLSISHLLNEGLKEVEVAIGNTRIKSVGIIVENELVWGATAKILLDLRDHLLKLPK